MLERKFGEVLTSISVGTALALESLVKLEKPLKVEYLFLNVRTLYRNFHNAFEDITKHDLTTLSVEFYTELETIKNIVETRVPGNMIPVFYLCSNKSLGKLFTFAKIKEPSTDKQIAYCNLERSVIESISTKPLGKKMQIFDCLIKGGNSNALILTHFPLELLSFSTFHSLKLLESNTGIIKDKSEWHTKLTNPEIHQNIPFNILSIQLIGDHATQFNSSGGKYTKPLLEIAIKNKWTVATTNAKVKYDIEKHWDKLLVNTYLEMLSVKLK